jgi:hypothetical protein
MIANGKNDSLTEHPYFLPKTGVFASILEVLASFRDLFATRKATFCQIFLALDRFLPVSWQKLPTLCQLGRLFAISQACNS